MSPPSTMTPSRTCCLTSKHLIMSSGRMKGKRKKLGAEYESSIKAFYLEYIFSMYFIASVDWCSFFLFLSFATCKAAHMAILLCNEQRDSCSHVRKIDRFCINDWGYINNAKVKYFVTSLTVYRY